MLSAIGQEPGAGAHHFGQELRGGYKVAPLVKAPAAKTGNMDLIPWTHKAGERTDSCKLSPDFHTGTIA